MYPNPERPGYGAFVWQQAEQLRRFDHIVDVVNILGFQSIMNYLKGAFEVLKKTSRITYGVVHAHYCLAEFPAWFWLQVPWVVTLQGSDALGSSQQTHSIFQAKALVLRENQATLSKFLDTPIVPAGGLYYMQNLVAALSAGGITTSDVTPPARPRLRLR
jgi:hypothetical protein